MFWYILGVACVIALIAGIIIANVSDWYDYVGIAMAVIAGLILFFILLLAPIVAAQDKQLINQYKLQKEYIENHVVKDSIENAALTNKKIELNSWLINAQYSKEKYSFFTFLPGEIMELTLIE